MPNLLIPAPEVVLGAVTVFNERYGEMESALWDLSSNARDALLSGRTLETEVLVWTVRSWWGVQGVQKKTAKIAGESIRRLGLDGSSFTQSLCDNDVGVQTCLQILSDVLATMEELGAPRREFSLMSKVLHWLMPWRMAAYDSFVCRIIGISRAAGSLDAYREILVWERKAALSLLTSGDAWMGAIEPKAPFRALDKFLWYEGGGSVNRSVIVKNPWRRIQDALAETSGRASSL